MQVPANSRPRSTSVRPRRAATRSRTTRATPCWSSSASPSRLSPRPVLLATQFDLLAHGVGGRTDLPVPTGLAVAAAAMAVLVSFLALGALWRTPQLKGGAAGRPLPAASARTARQPGLPRRAPGPGAARHAWSSRRRFLGPNETRFNIAPYVLYVSFWAGHGDASACSSGRLAGGQPPAPGARRARPAAGRRPRGRASADAAAARACGPPPRGSRSSPGSSSSSRTAPSRRSSGAFFLVYLVLNVWLGTDLRAALVRPRRRLRGVVLARRPDSPRGAAGTTGSSWSATRWTASPPSRSVRGWSRSSSPSSVRPRSTG